MTARVQAHAASVRLHAPGPRTGPARRSVRRRGWPRTRATFPAPLRAAVRAFAADSGPDGTLLLRGLPIGTVPATPLDPKSLPDKDRASELTLLAVARLLGEPVGYVQEHGGGIVQNIVPAPETEGRQVSTSSNVTLAWHTETAFHPHKPRYLLLLCLRGDAAAATLLCSVAHCLPHLDAETIATLRRPRFRTRPDESFLEPGAAGALGPPMAILAGDGEQPTFTYDEDLMVGIDAGAQAALDQLGAVVARPRVVDRARSRRPPRRRQRARRARPHVVRGPLRRHRSVAATDIRRRGPRAFRRGTRRPHHHDAFLIPRLSRVPDR